MKNYVILLAGGVGKRMGSDIPKQFLEVDGKPIIVYSIENFQRNPQIEKIVVVIVKDWIDKTWELVKKYSLTKVKWIIEGGSTGHDSIRTEYLQSKHLLRTWPFTKEWKERKKTREVMWGPRDFPVGPT